MRSRLKVTERAQPWLGTLVSIRLQDLGAAEANRAIDAAFAEIATVHRLMSFHHSASDVSRLNREGVRGPVTVHPYTLEVLHLSQTFAAASEGCFDISVGAELVGWRVLPCASGATDTAGGSWRDIELRADGQVLFHRPLCIDLGGIAKGYAVDRATTCLAALGVKQSVVNAGGDIRVQGRFAEPICLSAGSMAESRIAPREGVPVLQLANGSVAGSSGHEGVHVHGAGRSPVRRDRFVCVVAERCVAADALTKVVMAEGVSSAELLRRYGASAYMQDGGAEWTHIPAKKAARR